MNRLLILFISIFLIGCASSEKRIGSEAWYIKRMAEIEESYKNQKIDEATYQELKNEVDALRADYQTGRRGNTHTHFGYGSGGGGIGIGVGF